MKSGKRNVVLIDDHPIYRSGLKTVVESNGKYRVVGESATAESGMRAVMDIKPDIAIVDLTLPDMDGLVLTRDIAATNIKTHVMIVSAHSKINYVIKAIQAGALGYVIKESGAEAILKCLDYVSKGKKFIDHSLSESLCEWFIFMDSPADEALSASDRYGDLSKREQEVLRFIAEGYSMHEIGNRLNVSYKTVTSHKANIMRKLNLNSTRDIIRYAGDVGLVDLDG